MSGAEETGKEHISLFEGAIRRLRFMRCSGEPKGEMIRVAKLYQRNIGADPEKLLEEAAKPGPIP